MIELLDAIIADLEASGLVKTAFPTEFIGEGGDAPLPRAARLPAAGVRWAGEEPPEDMSAAGLRRVHLVEMALYVTAEVHSKDGLKTALDLAEAVIARLHRNLLGLEGCVRAAYAGSEGTDLVEGRAGYAVKTHLHFRYMMED